MIDVLRGMLVLSSARLTGRKGLSFLHLEVGVALVVATGGVIYTRGGQIAAIYGGSTDRGRATAEGIETGVQAAVGGACESVI